MLVLLVDDCPVPVDVRSRGVAQARALLADGASPIYHRASGDNLRARVLAATEELTPA